MHVDDIDSWLLPPTDMHDSAAWDKYWYNQVSHGLGPPLFDLFLSDDRLIEVLSEQGFRTVLCAGNGISQEPRVLAAAGFQVTALDRSPVALQIAETWQLEDSIQKHLVEFVVGDLLDPAICSGPFDVMIERRTLQLFSDAERERALDALLARLQPEGIFLSHCHDNRCRPPAQPSHPVRDLLLERGLTIWSDTRSPKPAGRVGWIQTSSG